MPKKEIALVVPTIREQCLVDFCERWAKVGLFDLVDLIVMEDNPKQTFPKFDLCKQHLSWQDIEAQLDEDQWIIPRRSDTVRSFAYWWAWTEKYKYIMTLDDDCYPREDQTGLELVSAHVDAMHNKSRWFNTLNTVKPRGVPFRNLGNRDRVVLNHGLWTGVLDYDAPTQLVSPDPEMFDNSSRIVPHGSYFPMCGMNLMWKSEVTVWMYHLLMGQRFYPEHPCADSEHGLVHLDLDRFGDIWCGIIMKRLCDLSGYEVTTGTPYIHHERASDPFKNLVKEAQGITINERFWQWVDDFSMQPTDLESMYIGMGHHVGQFSESVFCPDDYRTYFLDLGRAMVKWGELFLEGTP